MNAERPDPADTLVPLVVLAAVVGLTATGFAHGIWWANVHNGLLALAFGGVAAWTLLIRSAQREAMLMAVVGLLEGVLFLGRQIAHDGSGTAAGWWGWLGVWPLALILGTLTWVVLCFPEGRFLSPGWRRTGLAVAGLATVLSAVSALWPVEYGAAEIHTAPPFQLDGFATAGDAWDAVGHPAYAVFQLIWLIAVAARWRRANGIMRTQLAVLGIAVAIATAALLVGLVGWGSPRPGLLATPLLPVAAGWSMVGLSLGRVVEDTRARGGLTALSPRENDVLDLMAQGLSNKAISEQLHLSIKTVEPIVSSIFAKLQLPADETRNRRVLAVLALLEK